MSVKHFVSVFVLLVVVMLLLPRDVYALTLLDSVNVGDPLGEVGHGLVGWGPVEPATSGGTWGGHDDGTIRVTWRPV